MSFPLVTIRQIGHATTQAVDARELHAALGNGDHFATWMRDRIRQFDFSQGSDFVSYSEKTEKGAPRTEYAVSIDMAKELAMVERSPKGKQVRQYFIECERQAHATPAIPDFTNPAIAARAWAEQYEGREVAERRAAELAPKAEFFDKYVSATGLYGYMEAGTAAGCHPKKFCDWLKQVHLFYRGKKLVPRAAFVRKGLFQIKPDLDGKGEAHLRGYVTAKGVEYFAENAPSGIRVTGVLL